MAQFIEVIRLPGFVEYGQAMAIQRERRIAVEEGRAGNALYLLEHRPVITLGRSARRENLLLDADALAEQGIDLCETDRGGDVTYHGPGQLVAYPVLDLRQWRQSIRWYLRQLEEVLIQQLADYNIDAGRIEGLTGVWTAGRKVAAIGIAIRNWVTFHGIGLNVHPDLAHFDYIIPCGVPDKPVTSLHQLLGDAAPPMPQAMNDFEHHFRAHLGT
ncbi:MAG TPA: lipoyl(octanoyl) transferase LipB [Candidatus Hydrogenedentes bacterium]|nr:lipoyl(octanoyl) transferase LipB [Candidatus Hydrogenedentota bacterium]